MRLIARLLAAGAFLTLGACSSAPPPRPAPPPREAPVARPQPAPRAERDTTRTSLADDVVRLARSLIATPYRYAGADRRGFDCSGLTAFVYQRFGVPLPRTAATQARTGHWVAPDELAPGDLVFFGDSRDKPHHVGVVVSQPGGPLAMVHASSSRGVVETEVTGSAYWLERLRFGRRVLPSPR